MARRSIKPEDVSIQGTCVTCGERKQSPNGKGGYTAFCQPCKSAKYGIAKSTRETHLVNTYGITQADYDRMFAEQGGVCAICRKPQHHSRFSNLCVDHCHKTGAVRGLLCSSCNRAIGYLGDDLDRLQAAIRYLAK